MTWAGVMCVTGLDFHFLVARRSRGIEAALSMYLRAQCHASSSRRAFAESEAPSANHSEQQLKAQLDRAGISRPDDRVARRYIWSSAPAAEYEWRRWIPSTSCTESVRSPIRVRKIRVVENVEKLSPELAAESFAESPHFEYRNVPVPG